MATLKDLEPLMAELGVPVMFGLRTKAAEGFVEAYRRLGAQRLKAMLDDALSIASAIEPTTDQVS